MRRIVVSHEGSLFRLTVGSRVIEALSAEELSEIHRQAGDNLIGTDPERQEYDITFSRRGVEMLKSGVELLDNDLAEGLSIRLDMILGLWQPGN